MIELRMSVWNDILGIRKQVQKKVRLDKHNLQLWDGSSTDAEETNLFFLPMFSNQCLQLKNAFWETDFIVTIPSCFSKH
jgi:hypothetical protein